MNPALSALLRAAVAVVGGMRTRLRHRNSQPLVSSGGAGHSNAYLAYPDAHGGALAHNDAGSRCEQADSNAEYRACTYTCNHNIVQSRLDRVVRDDGVGDGAELLNLAGHHIARVQPDGVGLAEATHARWGAAMWVMGERCGSA